MSEPTVLLTLGDGIATITLNRPDRLNAMCEAMHAELAHVLDRIELDRAIRAVLLTGAGRGFCSGQDLNDRATVDRPDLGDTLDRLYNPLVRRLKRLERPVIAAVNGVAAGAGANLALACDIVLAAKSAVFVQAFVKIGLIPDAGGSYALPRLVGQARAMGLAMLGESIDGEQAADWGLIWRAVDDEQLMDEALGLARHLATQPTVALGLIKRAINASFSNNFEQQLELERELQRKAGKTEDFAEGVDAFLDRRPAAFKGR
ncbi:MAG: 2-(1,2-epoxy-1,2-dihydrophenyl)acetyl-CoA isomerase PaaG [Alphaproteobacteria bacterium]|nr:2-(1,2-epoxy-1,2-dihydrophenyl)acetyl-CoA isomerase PaaG [Alphaproteobacteria bacterium]